MQFTRKWKYHRLRSFNDKSYGVEDHFLIQLKDMKKHLLIFFICFLYLGVLGTIECAPVEGDNQPKASDAKSAFGVPFDEIVVDTSLIVKRKNPDRQSRNTNASKNNSIKLAEATLTRNNST
ncbi:uncharacterized protein LOC130444124 [Diorhabda sublineata]|uniref:uncharacterized protein LOC130444124 n=1 Tax=Diorhabda sublineata TaxID=1163346 RepID=UPI0024E0579D|nr:uncharacterized protein LOC130444124 [Diorhabda sublineata]